MPLTAASFVAHSVFQCIKKTKDSDWIPETWYYRGIEICFAPNIRGKLLEAGLTSIHCVENLCPGNSFPVDPRRDPDIEAIFRQGGTSGSPPRR